MITGISVTIIRPTEGTVDRFGDEVPGETRESVNNVLVAPGGDSGSTDDLEAARVDGDVLSLQVHFPKTYTGNLRGCQLELPAPWDAFNPYRIVGNPTPYIDANTPTPWHMPVRVEVARG